MNLIQYRGELRKDLKDSGTLWIDAELNRCIQRAVDDLSRHLPRERIYEHTWVEAVTDDSFTTPTTESADSIVKDEDISSVTDGSVCTLVTSWLDVPRPVKLTITDSGGGITAFTVIVKGTDIDGKYNEERFYRRGGLIQTGKINFFSVSAVEKNYFVGEGASDLLDLGTDEPDLTTGGIWIQLDNPIEPESESIYSAALKAGTKYTRDTDYEMDYANGRVRMKSGGALADNTTYYANYDRAPTAIDISSIIPELIRIGKVLYPADKVPEQAVAFSIWENMLIIGSPRTGASQEALTDGEHIAIYYEARHAPPTSVGPGSYPEVLDQVVLIGAGGYALLIEALQYEQQAVTDLGAVRSALVNVVKYLNNNSDADAAGILQDITDNKAELRTKIDDAVNAMATALGKVSSIDLDVATVGAVAWLLEGELLIDKLNDGKNVPENFADYARTKVQIGQTRVQTAMAYMQEATGRLENLKTYIAQSSGYNRIAEDFVAEAVQYEAAVANDMLLADRFRAEAQIRMAEFNTILASKAEYRKRVSSTPVRQPKS